MRFHLCRRARRERRGMRVYTWEYGMVAQMKLNRCTAVKRRHGRDAELLHDIVQSSGSARTTSSMVDYRTAPARSRQAHCHKLNAEETSAETTRWRLEP